MVDEANTGVARVKDLPWSVEGTGDRETHFGDSVIGRYIAWESGGQGYVITPGDLARRAVGVDLAAAKAACQADFNARILSALETGPSQGQG